MAKSNLAILGAASAFILLGKCAARCTKEIVPVVNKSTHVTEEVVNKSAKEIGSAAKENGGRAAVMGAHSIERHRSKHLLTGYPCYRCKGTGSISMYQNNAWQSYCCPICKGSGKMK